MNDTEMKQKIKISIQVFQKSGVSEAALRLFQTLGYNTNRPNQFSQNTCLYFKVSFLDSHTSFNRAIAFIEE